MMSVLAREPLARLTLEIMSYWERNLSAGRLGQALGLSRSHAQRSVIETYRREVHGRLSSGAGRRHIPFQAEAVPQHGPEDFEELLNILIGFQSAAAATGTSTPFAIEIVDVTGLCRSQGRVEALRVLCAALSGRFPVEVEYVSKNGLSNFEFSPHRLVRTADRVHVRGFHRRPGSVSGHYIDLVPGRIVSASAGSRAEFVGSAGDVEWHRTLDLSFCMAAGLPEAIAKVIQQEDLADERLDPKGHLLIRDVPLALVRYVVPQVTWRRFDQDMVRVRDCLTPDLGSRP